MKYELLSVGLDTDSINYKPNIDISTKYSYYHTSVSANNDFFLRDLIEGNEDAALVTTIEFLDKSWIALEEHLITLRRECVDFLLIDARCDFNKYSLEAKTLVESGYVSEWGISNPRSVKELENIQNLIGKIKYISLNLSPLNFNYEIVKWCKENGVSIFGFNSLGGNISHNVLLDGFTLPYLLNFAAVYCSVIFVSGRQLLNADKDRVYLDQLIDKEVKDEKIYKLEKTVDKLTKPIKRVIRSSLNISEGLTIAYNSLNLFNFEETLLTLDKPKEQLKDLENDTFTDLINGETTLFDKPEDMKSDYDYLSLVRPRIFTLFKSYFSQWITQFVMIDNNTFILSASLTKINRYLFKPNYVSILKTENYLLRCSGGKILFQKIKNANLNPSES